MSCPLSIYPHKIRGTFIKIDLDYADLRWVCHNRLQIFHATLKAKLLTETINLPLQPL